jgi:hypothetical protein
VLVTALVPVAELVVVAALANEDGELGELGQMLSVCCSSYTGF